MNPKLKSVEQWAEPLKDFGEDKYTHFMASYLAMSDFGYRYKKYPLTNIGSAFSKSLKVGIIKELKDSGRNDKSLAKMNADVFGEAFGGLGEFIHNLELDEGDMLANLAGIAYGMYQMAIGELVHMQNKGDI